MIWRSPFSLACRDPVARLWCSDSFISSPDAGGLLSTRGLRRERPCDPPDTSTRQHGVPWSLPHRENPREATLAVPADEPHAAADALHDVRHTIITLLLRLKVPMDPVYRAALEQSAHRRHLRIPGRERSPTVPNRALPFCSTGIPERRPITRCRSSRAPGMNEGRRPGSLRARRLQHMRDHLNAYRIPCSAVAAAAHWKNGRRSLGPA